MTLLTPRDTLNICTVRKSPIRNYLNRGQPTAGAQLEVNKYIADYVGLNHRTRFPCLRYNCHGLTFASRRTAIEDSSEVQKILNEDHYDRVAPANVKPGDIIIYRALATDGGEIEHSGIVVHVPAVIPIVPVIVSKWGYGHEVVHPYNVCPYPSPVEYYRVVP